MFDGNDSYVADVPLVPFFAAGDAGGGFEARDCCS